MNECKFDEHDTNTSIESNLDLTTTFAQNFSVNRIIRRVVIANTQILAVRVRKTPQILEISKQLLF